MQYIAVEIVVQCSQNVRKKKNEHYANRGESPKELVALTCSFR